MIFIATLVSLIVGFALGFVGFLTNEKSIKPSFSLSEKSMKIILELSDKIILSSYLTINIQHTIKKSFSDYKKLTYSELIELGIICQQLAQLEDKKIEDISNLEVLNAIGNYKAYLRSF